MPRFTPLSRGFKVSRMSTTISSRFVRPVSDERKKGKLILKVCGFSKINMRFIHDKYSQLEVDLLFMAADLPDGMFQWPSFMRLLLNRSLESELFEEVILTSSSLPRKLPAQTWYLSTS